MAAASEGSVSASMLTKSRNSPVKWASVMCGTPPVAWTGGSATVTEIDSSPLVVVTRDSAAAGARRCTRPARVRGAGARSAGHRRVQPGCRDHPGGGHAGDPAATAQLLTDRFGRLLLVAVGLSVVES